MQKGVGSSHHDFSSRNKQQQPEGGTRPGKSDAFETKVLKETTHLENGLVNIAGGEREGRTERAALTQYTHYLV